MRVQIRNILLGSFVLMNLAGCSNSKSESAKTPTTKIDTKQILANKNLADSEKSEQLAKAAEQLLTVQGFAFASDVADLALQQDPNNLRAKFVKAILAPIMSQKGILARIAPLAEKDEELKAQYDEMMVNLENQFPNSTLKSFLLEGTPDIDSEKGIQDYLDSMANGFRALRLFAKQNKNSSLTVMTSDLFFAAMKKRFEESCIVIEPYPGEYEYQCPSPVNMLEVQFSRADFEGVQQIAAAYELYLSLYNSYNLDGSIQVALDHKDQPSHPAAQEIIQELLQNRTFATLREGTGLKRLKEMGLDAITGMRWVIRNQNSLCPLGKENPRNRLGFLFNHGLCVQDPSNATRQLKHFEDVVSGKLIKATFVGRGGDRYDTVMKPAAWVDAPINDLRMLTPLKFNECEELTEVSEGTAGGIFPRADVNSVIKLRNNCL